MSEQSPLPHHFTAKRGEAELKLVFGILGKRWNGLVLWFLIREGPLRFSELASAVEGISERLLSERLTELQSAGLVARESTGDAPAVVRYAVTAQGAKLRRPLEALRDWAFDLDVNADDTATPPTTR